MNKVFIFDLDGVLIDDESIWERTKQKMYLELFGEEIIEKMGSTVGINMDGIYELATKHGSKISKEKLVKAFYDQANEIYSTAPITDGIDELVTVLKENNFSIGIVSASPKEWIDIVMNRLPKSNEISLVLSLFDRPDLPHKPAPDGYTEALKKLESDPHRAIALEDSNAGITSAKAAGLYTIGLKQNLVDGYIQKGADIYADNLTDVIKIVKAYNESN